MAPIIISVIFIIIFVALLLILTPKSAPANACAKYSPTSTNLDQGCLDKLWKDAGCTTTDFYKKGDWKNARTKSEIEADIKTWATKTTDDHRKGCYGTIL